MKIHPDAPILFHLTCEQSYTVQGPGHAAAYTGAGLGLGFSQAQRQ